MNEKTLNREMSEESKGNYVFFIFLPLIVGAISALISRKGMKDFQTMFESPPLQPAPIVFMIAWSILYLLLGIGLYRVLKSGELNTGDAFVSFCIQMILNFAWSPIFFNLNSFKISSVVLVAILVATIIMTVYFFKCDKISGYIQIPYNLWLCFALYLNIATDYINR